MTDKTWIGTTINPNYDDSLNWSPTGVPSTGDRAIFGSGGAKTVSLATGPLNANAWLFTGGAYDIQLSTTIVLKVAGIQVSAGSALIEAFSGGGIEFRNNSSAGTATLDAHTGGSVTFTGNSNGGIARLMADLGGTVDFSTDAGPQGVGNFAGSIEGAGIFALGGHLLTVGDNNRSTTVTGNIQGIGGALTKVGTGTLTLAGSNTFTGALTINGGTVDLASLNADFGSFIAFGGGAQTLRIENAALSANEFSPLVHAFGFGDTIDLHGLPFVPGATATYSTSTFTLTVTSGSTTVTLDDLDGPAGTHFAALGDDKGGTRVMLATFGTAGNNLIDGSHAPAGQHRPTNGPDVVLGLGGNDTLKGLGGNDVLVGGTGKDLLFGGPGGDSFVFQAIADSKPGAPDVIQDFSSAQHDKIDLYDIDADQRGAAPGNQAFVFIGSQTFLHFHQLHPTVFGMVRYAGGVVQANVNAGLAPDFAITIHGAPPLHPGDFVL